MSVRERVEEFGGTRALELTAAQREALLGFGDRLKPEPVAGGKWVVRASSHVGTAVLPGLEVRVHPKVSVGRLFEMLSAATGRIAWGAESAGLSVTDTVEDVTAELLLREVWRRVPTGLLRGYVEEEEEGYVVRGRLELAETMRRRPATLLPVVQSPEFHSDDVPENRILVTALRVMGRRARTGSLRARLNTCASVVFGGVRALRQGERVRRVARNRLNARWWGAVELAELVLGACGLDLPEGGLEARSFMVDMNAVFEAFVFRALEEALAGRKVRLEHQAERMALGEDGSHKLRPDLSVWEGGCCRYAGDCKYKALSGDAGPVRAEREDMYQALAYAKAGGLESVTLFYALREARMGEVRVVSGGPTVCVRGLGLGGSTRQLREFFAGEAARIAEGIVTSRLRRTGEVWG